MEPKMAQTHLSENTITNSEHTEGTLTVNIGYEIGKLHQS